MFIIDPVDMDDSIILKQGKCKAVIATKAHAEYLAPRLRRKDIVEVHIGGFDSAQEALDYGIGNDKITITALDAEDNPFAMFGVGNKDGVDYIWLLGTDGVEKHRYDFLKACKIMLPALLTDYPSVTNIVYAEYKAALSWLKWLGATFTRPLLINDLLFYEFIIINNDY